MTDLSTLRDGRDASDCLVGVRWHVQAAINADTPAERAKQIEAAFTDLNRAAMLHTADHPPSGRDVDALCRALPSDDLERLLRRRGHAEAALPLTNR